MFLNTPLGKAIPLGKSPLERELCTIPARNGLGYPLLRGEDAPCPPMAEASGVCSRFLIEFYIN